MRRWSQSVGRLGRNESGAAAIEFAIISLVLILVCLAVIEFGRGLHVRNQLSYVADYGARKILLDPGIAHTELETEIRDRFRGDLDSLEIGPSSTDEDGFRTLQLSYPFTLLIPGLGGEPIRLSLDRRVPIS